MVREVAVRAAHGLRRPFSVDRRSSEHSLRRKKLASPARLESFDSAHQMEVFRLSAMADQGGVRPLMRRTRTSSHGAGVRLNLKNFGLLRLLCAPDHPDHQPAAFFDCESTKPPVSRPGIAHSIALGDSYRTRGAPGCAWVGVGDRALVDLDQDRVPVVDT